MDAVPAASPERRARGLSRMTAYSWSRHWPAEALMGVSGGVLNLAAFSLQRSMGAPDWTSPALVVLGQGLWILAPAWPVVLSRVKRQSTFLLIGLLSRAPLLLMALASVTRLPGGEPDQGLGSWWLLFATFLITANLDAVYTPHRNALIRANYPLTVRGRIYGLVTFVTVVCSIAAGQGAGWLLDHDPGWVRVVFPVSAVVGLAAFVLMARIRWRRDGPRLEPVERGLPLVRSAMRDAIGSSVRTLKEDHHFRDFELAFMLYGLGLLSATPLMISHFAKTLDTEEWARADRLVLPATQLALIWAVGRLSDRIGVVRVGGFAFALLVPFFLWMRHVETANQLAVAFVLYGVCMAGVNVSWALGPLHFAPPGRAHHYSSVHVACVGVRSLAGPAIGYAVYKIFSFSAALIVAAVLEAAAAVVAFRLARRIRSA